MFFRRTDYTKSEKVYYIAIKIAIKCDASYEELLLLSNEVPIHQKHLHLLLTETISNRESVVMSSFVALKYMQNGPHLSLSSS